MDFKDTSNQQRFANKSGMFTDKEKGLMKSLSAGNILENYTSDLLSQKSYGPKPDINVSPEAAESVSSKFSTSTVSEASFKSDERAFRGESTATFKSSMEFVDAADQKAVESARAKAVDTAINDPQNPIITKEGVSASTQSSYPRTPIGAINTDRSIFLEETQSERPFVGNGNDVHQAPFVRTDYSEAEMAQRIEQFQIHMTDSADNSPLDRYGDDVIRQYTAQAVNPYQSNRNDLSYQDKNYPAYGMDQDDQSMFVRKETAFQESGAEFKETALSKGQQFITNERDIFEGYGGIDALNRMYGVNARWSRTNTAGGARSFTSRDDAGNYISQVFLTKGSERIPEKGIRYKAVGAFEKAGYTSDLVGPEDNEAAASNVDDKISKVLDGVVKRQRGDVQRYHQLGLEKSEEIKNIDRYTGRVERKQVEGAIFSPFAKSNYSFQDSNKEFVDKAFSKFRIEGMNHNGGDLFIERVSTDEQVLQAGVFASGASVIGGQFDSEEAVTGEAFSVDPHRAFGNTGNELTVGRFEDTKELSDGNKNLKSVESHFSDKKNDLQEKKELRKEKRAEKKALSKEEKKALKKAAAIAAVSRVLIFKRDTQNMLGDMSGQVSDDLMAEGSKGLLGSMINAFRDFMIEKIKALFAAILRGLGGMIMPIITTMLPIILFLLLVLILVALIGSLFWEESTPDAPAGDGYTFSSLSNEQIEEIINNVYLSYGFIRDNEDPDRDYIHEDMMRYALTKVGCAYSQDYHWSMTANIYDCSSLAYRTYRSLGIDVSRGGYYCAADEYKQAVESGHAYREGSLMPGDLIFYGGADNGRYMGVYHVAIYIGNGKMVEARGTKSGVVYCDYRSKKVVGYARYI